MFTVEGVYKDGEIRLLENVQAMKDSKVLVTFLDNSDVELSALGLAEDEAAELRDNFAAFEDWNDPALDIYNNYDNAKAALGDRA